MVTRHQVLVASNRGPVSYTVGEGGELTARRGGGGLVSGLSAVKGDAVWVCSALGDGDREAVRRTGGELDPADTGGQQVRMLGIAPEVFSDAYNGIANSVLWFVHHMLYQTPLEPAFDVDFERQWRSYEAYNTAFADALAEEAAEGAAVLVQDYHLTLVPGLLRERRPDLRIGHFSHTPWSPPDYFRLLPQDPDGDGGVAAAVLRGILGADRAAFLTRRWAEAFTDCCARVLGAEVTVSGDGETRVTYRGRTTRIGVHGLGADADFLRERSRQPDVAERMAVLREQIGRGPDGTERRTIVRVDRTELSKNIVRGLLAYRRLLDERPEWRGRVVHLAFAYPSRQDLEVYRHYTAEVSRLAEEINTAYGTEDWTPVVLHVKDDFARSLAAYRLADVGLVNPIRDGMNLVAKEIPVVSDHGCALVLSREAGAFAELGEDAIAVNPYDIGATADALYRALTMDRGERAERTKRLATSATALPPTQWFLDQLDALRA
ncbi:MAG TPA: trehalose-6-phosphate synthase [Streptomyces sp.]|nr:trehalose-6-phosphate synthase [Streptomyces sp.]